MRVRNLRHTVNDLWCTSPPDWTQLADIGKQISISQRTLAGLSTYDGAVHLIQRLCYILAPLLSFQASRLRTILLPLPHKKSQSKIVRLECDFAPLWKEEHIPLLGLDLLARFVADVEVPINNDLDLIISISIHQWRSLL